MIALVMVVPSSASNSDGRYIYIYMCVYLRQHGSTQHVQQTAKKQRVFYASVYKVKPLLTQCCFRVACMEAMLYTMLCSRLGVSDARCNAHQFIEIQVVGIDSGYHLKGPWNCVLLTHSTKDRNNTVNHIASVLVGTRTKRF